MISTDQKIVGISSPGHYWVAGNCMFDSDDIQGILNLGSTDCMATVTARVDVIECKCEMHRDRHGAHGEGTQFCAVLMIRERETLINLEWVPLGSPVRVRIQGFSEPINWDIVQTPPPVVELPRLTVDTPLLVTPYHSIEGHPAMLHPTNRQPYGDQTQPNHETPVRPPAGLFPGFAIRCERCGSVNISLDTTPKGAVLECEHCGTMCRVKL